MAKYSAGEAFGDVTGKLYHVVAQVVNGIHILRALPTKSKSEPSTAQQDARKKMEAVVAAIRPYLSTLRKGFLKVNHNAWALAVKANYRMLTTTADDGYTILPQDLQLSNGARQFDVLVEREGDKVSLAWEAPTENDDLYEGDLYVVIVNPANGRIAEFSAALSAGESNFTFSTLKAAEEDKLYFYSFAATKPKSSETVFENI